MKVAHYENHFFVRIRKGIRVFALIPLLVFFLNVPLVFAAAINSSQTGLIETATNAGLNTANVSVPTFVGTVINIILSIIGVVFLILIVYGGVQWMLAQGEESKIGKARGLILHSIIGLMIILAAYAISSFVVNTLISQTLQ